MNQISTIILAAGQGKRMGNPNLAKVMAELSGKPLIGRVLDQTKELKPLKNVVIVGFCRDAVINYVKSQDTNIEIAVQEEQLGSGHAAYQAKANFTGFDGDILILSGDVPLMKSSTLQKFIDLHIDNKSDVSVLSAIAPNPTGYGRIIRNAQGEFERITEEKDCNENEKKIDEINSGIYVVNSKYLFTALESVKSENAQNEYYLTDIVEILKKENKSIAAFNLCPFDEIQGVNSPQDLERAEKIFLNN